MTGGRARVRPIVGAPGSQRRAPAKLDRLAVRDPGARGLAADLASHAIATAQMLELDPVAGALDELAVILNAALTALLVPMVLALLTD